MIARTIRLRSVPSVLLVGVLALAALVLAPRLEARGQDTNISVALVGQALIKSDVCATAPAAFEQARGYLKGVDVAFTNLEVAIAPPGQKLTPRSATAVPAPPVVIDCLKSMGFNVLSLANNHAFDLQRDGIAATIGEVRKRGLVHAGTGADADAAAAAGVLETPKGKVALVAMATGAQLVPETWAAPGRPGVNYLERLPDGRPNPEQKQRILDAVRAAARITTITIGATLWAPVCRQIVRSGSGVLRPCPGPSIGRANWSMPALRSTSLMATHRFTASRSTRGS